MKLANPCNTGALIKSVLMKFSLHTEPRANSPEFTVSCRTEQGPATTVKWTLDGLPVYESEHETSQIILDTQNSIFENRLRVRGRRAGMYNCSVSNNIKDYYPSHSFYSVNGSLTIKGSST